MSIISIDQLVNYLYLIYGQHFSMKHFSCPIIFIVIKEQLLSRYRCLPYHIVYIVYLTVSVLVWLQGYTIFNIILLLHFVFDSVSCLSLVQIPVFNFISLFYQLSRLAQGCYKVINLYMMPNYAA